MQTIFDLIISQDIAAYWTTLSQDEAPYLGEELFPAKKKRGLNLDWIKGAKGLPVILKNSAFDAAAVPRPRIGFDKLSAQMPYFKEDTYVDEELRQELNMVLETGNQAYIDSVLLRIFDDETSLLRGAAAVREAMRMMALTSGVVSLINNGQNYFYDYGITHKSTVTVSWSDYANSDPIEDIRAAKEEILDDTGATITRAVCDGVTWRNLRRNEGIKKSIFILSNGQGNVSDTQLRQYLIDEVGLDVVVNDKRYKDAEGSTYKYIPSNTFAMFPSGPLGSTWFGTTPAESDLMSGANGVTNVSIVDTGVAVVTAKKHDPVQIQTIVSQICMPSLEAADEIYILDTEA